MTATKQLTEEEELAILFPEPVVVKIGERLSVSILPMDMAAFAHFARSAKPIISAALASSPPTQGSFLLEEFVGAALVAAMDYPDEAVAALSIATGKSAAFIGKLPTPIAADLARKVFRINADFFAQSAALPGSDAQDKSPGLAPAGVGPTH